MLKQFNVFFTAWLSIPENEAGELFHTKQEGKRTRMMFGRRSSSRTAYRLRLRSSPLCSLRRSSSPKKVMPRLCCSLVNTLAMRRLATNFFRYQEVRCCAFPPVGNAHRAFRGGKRAHVPCGRSTGKHDIVEKIHNKLFQSMQCPSVDGRFVIIRCTSPRSARVHRPYDLSG